MTMPMYVLACVSGLALGWFGYAAAKSAFIAIVSQRPVRGRLGPPHEDIEPGVIRDQEQRQGRPSHLNRKLGAQAARLRPGTRKSVRWLLWARRAQARGGLPLR